LTAPILADSGPSHGGPGHATPQGAPWTFLIGIGGVTLLVALAGGNNVATIIALLVQCVFFVFFVRHLSFAVCAIRSAPADLRAPVVDSGYRPPVSVIVACKNEQTVVDHLVDGLLALDYPPALLQLIVVDDGSDDRTPQLLDERAAHDERLLVHHRSPASGGGKSGALNDGLGRATGEIIVVFDADHHPRPDVIRRLVRHFEDPVVAAVQGRCEISNPGDSALSQLVAIDYYAGYLVNEYGRQALYQLPAYGGANCAVRAADLRAAGGWNPETVTEDTDLTIRLLLAGRRVRYDVTAVDEEEGVVTLTRYWRQRYRWARGHQQVWRDYRRAVVRTPHLSPAEKLETVLFLLVFHLPAVAALGLGILAFWLTGLAQPHDPVNVFVLWTLLFLGPLLELGGGLLVAQVDRRTARYLALFMPIFFVGIAVCTKAWLDGILGRPYSWAKTRRADEPLELA
jgi:cellulose synthase/poly-beta-1,6-N-acetylglucosamine synthase-like glycosyltransferase